MDWNELRGDWQTRESATVSRPVLPAEIVRSLWRRVRFRDAIETLVALPLVPFFAYSALRFAQNDMPVAAAFAAFLAAVVIYIPIRLWQARRCIPVADPGQPVQAFLEAERTALRAQSALLSSVARWYWGPIAFGTIGLYVSIRGWGGASLAYAGCVAIVCIWIEWLNRRAVRKRFVPALEALEEHLDAMKQQGEDNDANN